MLRIEFISGVDDGRQFVFNRDEVQRGITIGRRDTSDIVIAADTLISRLHATLFVEEAKLFLRDEGSRNGSFLGRVRIETPVELKTGDMFRVGRTSFEIIEFEV